VTRGPCHFRQQDVRRAIEAARKAGLSIARVEIDPKTAVITVVAGLPSDSSQSAAEPNPWDTAEPYHPRRKRQCVTKAGTSS
jgi:hypothetical protein